MHVTHTDCHWLGGMAESNVSMFIQASSLPPSQGNRLSH